MIGAEQMKVYELIQELVQYSADADVEIEVTVNEQEIECLLCKADITAEQHTESSTIDGVTNRRHVVLLTCEV